MLPQYYSRGDHRHLRAVAVRHRKQHGCCRAPEIHLGSGQDEHVGARPVSRHVQTDTIARSNDDGLHLDILPTRVELRS